MDARDYAGGALFGMDRFRPEAFGRLSRSSGLSTLAIRPVATRV
jgi:hypothetical protein